jgi:hypothetical protein
LRGGIAKCMVKVWGPETENRWAGASNEGRGWRRAVKVERG